MTIGDVAIFGMQIGEVEENSLYAVVRTFVAGNNVSKHDDDVYIPGFVNAIQRSLDDLRSMPPLGHPPSQGESPEQMHIALRRDEHAVSGSRSFLVWGPTTNSVVCFLIPTDHEDEVVLTFEFWDEPPETGPALGHFVLRRNPLIADLERAVDELTPGSLRRFRRNETGRTGSV